MTPIRCTGPSPFLNYRRVNIQEVGMRAFSMPPPLPKGIYSSLFLAHRSKTLLCLSGNGCLVMICVVERQEHLAVDIGIITVDLLRL